MGKVDMSEEKVVLKLLLGSTRDSYVDLFSPPKKSYEKLKPINRLPIGNTAFDHSGEDIYINLTPSETTCRIAAISATGGGKTFLIKSMCSMMHQQGYMLSVINDIKNEWIESREPIYQEMEHLVHPKYDIKGLPVIPLVPKFLQMTNKDLYQGLVPFQFDMTQVNLSDMKTLMGYSKKFFSERWVNALDHLWNHYLSQGVLGNGFSFDKMISDVNDKDKFHSITKHLFPDVARKTLLSKLYTLRYTQMFGEESVSFEKMLAENLVPSMCTMGADKLGNIGLVYVYLAIYQRVLRLIMEDWRAKGKKGLSDRRLVEADDEVVKIAPSGKHPSSKDECNETLERGASIGIYQVFGAQKVIGRIDENLISQSQYVLINAATDGEDVNLILKKMNVPYDTKDYIKENLSTLKPIKTGPHKGSRGWFLLEKGMSGKPEIIYPYAPTCKFQMRD